MEFLVKHPNGNNGTISQSSFNAQAATVARNQDEIRSLHKVDSSDSDSADYLYSIDALDVDYKYVTDNRMAARFACSAFKAGNFVGRNFDFYYNNFANLVVHTPAKPGRYASVGVGGYCAALTKQFADTRHWATQDGFEPYRYSATALLDGVNSQGFFAEINVVPNDQAGYTNTYDSTGRAHSKACAYTKIDSILLVRYMLDNFASCAEAIDPANPKSLVNIDIQFTQEPGFPYEHHFLIADKDASYVIELTKNKLSIIESDVMTNFHLTGLDLSGDLDWTAVEPHGCGLERYEAIKAGLGSVSDTDSALSLLDSIRYTQTYTETEKSKLWKTELTGIGPDFDAYAYSAPWPGGNEDGKDYWKIDYPEDWGEEGYFRLPKPQSKIKATKDYTVQTPIDDFIPYFEWARKLYAAKDRNADSTAIWQSVHSAVYDLENLTLTLANQEDYAHPHKFALNSYTQACPNEPDHIYAVCNGEWLDITDKL